jgi:hypothetical protein
VIWATRSREHIGHGSPVPCHRLLASEDPALPQGSAVREAHHRAGIADFSPVRRLADRGERGASLTELPEGACVAKVQPRQRGRPQSRRRLVAQIVHYCVPRLVTAGSLTLRPLVSQITPNRVAVEYVLTPVDNFASYADFAVSPGVMPDGAVSRLTVADDQPAAEPRNCCSAGTKSLVDSPRRNSNGNTSDNFGVLRAHGGRIAEEKRLRSPVFSSTRRSFTRGALTCTSPADVDIVRSACKPLRTISRRPAPSRAGHAGGADHLDPIERSF